nr:AAA family ATPase [Streptomyces sp. SID4985]
MDVDGSHLPAALYRVAHTAAKADPEQVYARVAGRLSDLTGVQIRELGVDQDEVRQLLTVQVREADGMLLPARSLSEGTLRFLALCVLLEDPTVRGMICMEEPENGIHPANLNPMVELVQDLAVNPTQPPGTDNPFRQVLINTHSPGVVQLLSPEDLLFADTAVHRTETAARRAVCTCVRSPVPGGWLVKGVTTSPRRTSSLTSPRPRGPDHRRPGGGVTLRILFTGEGTSDNGLVPHIEMVAAERGVQAVVTAPDFGRLGPDHWHAVTDRLRAVISLGDTYDLVIVHRDADRVSPDDRRKEVAEAVTREWLEHPHIAVVPVRAIEAWLLLDESAIRRIAESPNGRMHLDLPKAGAVERIADPKRLLQETLAAASGVAGRRLTTFRNRFPRHHHKLLESLDPYGPVSQLPSWQAFLSNLNAVFLRA